MDHYDFIAIGDITTDEFIELRKDRAKIITDERGRETLTMNWGDKLEFAGAVNVPAVGNSPNAAVSATRLGLKTALVTDIGDDAGGEEIMKRLKEYGVDTRFVDVEEGKETNHHYVLRYGPERTILIKHETYAYALPAGIGTPRWLYFSSVGEHALAYHHEIAAFVRAHPETKLAFQPGSLQILLGATELQDVYAASELFFCNKEEAQRILESDEDDMRELLKRIRALGPNMPVITDGPGGAYVLEGETVWHMPMYPDSAPPVDRTGAGDAFSSTFTAACALGLDVPTALRWGPINSMSVVQYVGAQEGLLTRTQLETYLTEAPSNYAPQKL